LLFFSAILNHFRHDNVGSADLFDRGRLAPTLSRSLLQACCRLAIAVAAAYSTVSHYNTGTVPLRSKINFVLYLFLSLS